MAMVEASAAANRRSMNQEVIWRLQSSFELDTEAVRRAHQAWIDQALQSGRPRSLTEANMDAALKAGLLRAKARRHESR